MPIKFKTLYDVSNITQLANFASKFSKLLASGIEIGLKGDLAYGKTTFIATLLEQFGHENIVTSPSYVLCHEYQVNNLNFEHWDLYRLAELPEELYDLPDSRTVRAIEWVDKFKDIEMRVTYLLKFEYDYEANTRSIIVVPNQDC